MPHHPSISLLALALATLASTPAASAAEPAPGANRDGTRPPGWTTDPDAVCPPRASNILAIGSSTMGAPLGGMLERAFKAQCLTFHRLAAASSGLARPDFWDWAAKARRLVAEHDPEVVIVQLGSNDFQPVTVRDTPRSWRPIRRSKPEWADIYGARIDELLTILGSDRPRLILWLGPYAFWGDNATEQGPIIDQLLRDRISTWVAKGGFARYVDVWRETYHRTRGPVMKRALPGKRGLVEIRADDRIHLNVVAVQSLLVDPIVAHVLSCRSGAPSTSR